MPFSNIYDSRFLAIKEKDGKRYLEEEFTFPSEKKAKVGESDSSSLLDTVK